MPFTFTSTGGSGEGTPGKDSLFLGTWNSVTEFLASHQGGPTGLVDGDWWAFVKDNENPNKVYVVREDPTSATGWVIDDNEHFVLTGGADTGQITFNGVYIIGAGTGSGDGAGNGTIKLLPDVPLVQNQYHEDQYLIVDPTAPNHIHLRSGGVQDASTADLFIGGERNHVRVSDGARNVSISTRPQPVYNTYTNLNSGNAAYFVVSNTANIYVGDTVYYGGGGDIFTVDSVTQDSPSPGLITVTANINGTPATFANDAYVFTHEQEWNNYWQFGSDGYLTGPAMGGLFINGVMGLQDYPLYFSANKSVVISGNDGEFLNSESVPGNQIATIGDLPTGATGTFMSGDNQLITVTNGIITTINSLN
jgi:hypothetical protein